MLRARELRALKMENAERMLDAAGFEDAAKLLTDHGYEDMSAMSAKEIDAALNAKKCAVLKEIETICPDAEAVEFFRIKYDCHNAKLILKSEATGTDASAHFSGAGRIEPEKLENYYHEEKYFMLPGNLGEAMKEAKSVLSRTANPQASDFVLDRAYLNEQLALAEESGNEFLKGYAKILVDAVNLKSAVRTLKMGKSFDFLASVLVDGGEISARRIASASDENGVAALFANTKLEKAAQLGAAAVSGAGLTEFEKSCDNAISSYLADSRLVAFGPEVVITYIANLENELTAVRMILTGRLAGVKSEVIRERLRDIYA